MAISKPLTDWYNTKVPGAPATPGLMGTVNPIAYNPSQLGDANKWAVDRQQTVQGQLQDVIKTDSPLQQQARTAGLQQANDRGLLNSSIAVGAAQDAVIKSALPIATSDASTYARAGEYNTTEANKRDLENINAQNFAKNQGMLAYNEAGAFNAGAYNTRQTASTLATTNAAAAARDVEARRLAAAAQQAYAKESAHNQQIYTATNLGAENFYTTQQKGISEGIDTRSDQRKIAADKATAKFQAETNAISAELLRGSSTTIAEKSHVADMNRQFMVNETAIDQDVNMNQQSKDYAHQQNRDRYKAGLSLLSATGNTADIGALLNTPKEQVAATAQATGLTATFQPTLTGNPKWAAILNKFQATHYQRYGVYAAGDPAANPESIQQYNALVAEYNKLYPNG